VNKNGRDIAGLISIIGKSITVLHNQRQKYVASIMAKHGLGSTSYGLLLTLQKQEGIMQRELCAALFVDIGLASRTMGALERKGYIIRKRSKEDARSYKIYLTPKAKAIIPELHRGYEEWWEQLCKGISDKDMKVLGSLLKAMAEQAIGGDLFPAGNSALDPL
jgi:DNA-binding MarR family transcriptional regulator